MTKFKTFLNKPTTSRTSLLTAQNFKWRKQVNKNDSFDRAMRDIGDDFGNALCKVKN